MIDEHLYLMGFMASGKSSLGKRLSRQLQMPFVDLDKYIEAEENRTISKIFDEEGEVAFRQKEQEYLSELSQQRTPQLIALGGGTPCSEKNLQIIKSSGRSIYLKVDPEILIGRLRQKADERPLVKYMDSQKLAEFVRSTLKAREPYYLQADHILESDNPRPDEVVKLLKSS